MAEPGCGVTAYAAPDGADAEPGPAAAATAPPVRAAGAVVWRPGPDGPQVALIHRQRYDDWTFPKGKCEPGEHVLQTAVREVEEETGLAVRLGRPLGQVSYWTGPAGRDERAGAGARPGRNGRPGRAKLVDYWSAEPAVPADRPWTPNSEVDALEWLPVPAALGRLTYAHDAGLLAAFQAAPAQTAALILVRHASAGDKAEWDGQDLARPLDAAGTADAAALAGLLACYGTRTRVVSSPALRCTATIAPFAVLAGLPIELEPSFAPAPPEPVRPGRAAQVVAAIATARQPAVLCAHRENLPVLLGVACGELGSPPPQGAELAKGGFWVLHTASGRLAGAERHDNSERPVPG
jgi:8-oxo-(d)GTP phosphatase